MTDSIDANELRAGGCYHASIVLNNLGVELIAARHYNSALNTFKDAIEAIKTVIRHDAKVTNQSRSSGSMPGTALSNIAALVDRAKARVAANQDDSPECGQMENMNQDSRSSVSFSTCPRVDSIDNSCSPLHISVDDIDLHCRNPEIVSGIILFNFGVAHRYVSRHYQNSYSYDLSHAVLRLFKMACCVLSDIDGCPKEHPRDFCNSRLLVLTIVINSLIQVLEEEGAVDEILKWRLRLIHVDQSMVDAESCVLSPYFIEPMSHAPAA